MSNITWSAWSNGTSSCVFAARSVAAARKAAREYVREALPQGEGHYVIHVGGEEAERAGRGLATRGRWIKEAVR